MDQLITALTSFISTYGSLGVFLASIVEEVIVPIPSTLVQSGAGLFLLSGEPFSFHGIWILISRVAVPSAVGATIGSLVIYGILYAGGVPAVHRFGKYFFLRDEKLERARQIIQSRKGLWVALIALRVIPILPSVLIAAASGLVRMPLWLYVATSCTGFFLRALYLGGAGWVAGNTYHTLSPTHSIVAMLLWLLGIIAVISLTGIIFVRYGRKRKKI